ncbi:MAG: PAS domain-containing sensor histidine kinase [Bacteroidota bacterium]
MKKLSKRLTINIISHFLVAIVLLIGVYKTWEAYALENKRMSNDILSNALIIERALNQKNIDSLKCNSEDINSIYYKELKAQLKKIREGYKKIRFIYLLNKKADNSIYFFVDSENHNSKDYSPPGQKYSEADQSFYKAFYSNTNFITKPYTDRWGTWVTAIIPIKSDIDDKISSVLCVDSDANEWEAQQLQVTIQPIVITLLFVVILIVVFTWIKRSQKEKENLMKLSESLSLSEEKYRKIFENVQDMFFQADRNGIVIEMSPSVYRYSGYTSQELIGTEMAKYYYNPEDRERFVSILKQNREVSDYEIKMKGKNGNIVYTSVNAHLLFDNNNNYIGVEGSLRDVTERKKMDDMLRKKNEELSTLNAMKDKFFSIIAHDIKNPFNHIIGFSSLLNKNASKYDVDEIQKYSKIVYESSLITYELLEELLTWSKSQSGQLNINTEIFDFTAIIEDVVLKYNYLSQNKLIEIKTEINHVSRVFADEPTIKTVFRNLLNNAIKYTNENGCIIVATEENEDFIKVSITDNGIGIEKDDIEKLFRIDSSTKAIGTSGEKGSGLGLILCKEFVEKNGGEIGLYSEFGIGSTFFFTVPKSVI